MKDLHENHFRMSGASWVNIIYYYDFIFIYEGHEHTKSTAETPTKNGTGKKLAIFMLKARDWARRGKGDEKLNL